MITASASNLGATPVTPSAAHPLTITDTLPPVWRSPRARRSKARSACPAAAEQSLEECAIETERRKVTCRTASAAQPLAAYRELKMRFPVTVAAGATSGEQNTVTVSGGEAEGARPAAPGAASSPSVVKDEPTPSVSNATRSPPKTKTARRYTRRARTPSS